MGAIISAHSKKIVPVKVGEGNQNNGRINSLKLILKNEPFVYAFQRIVELHGKNKLLAYNEELEKLKDQVLSCSDCIIPNTRTLISDSEVLHKLFYTTSAAPASPKRFIDKANQRIENIAIENLQPLLLTEPHENIAVKQYHRLLRSCQHALLLHLLPELDEYMTTMDFLQYEDSDVLVYRNIFRQVKLLNSKRGNEEEGSVTAMVECSADGHSARTAPVNRLSRRLSSFSNASTAVRGSSSSTQRMSSTHRLFGPSPNTPGLLLPSGGSAGSLYATPAMASHHPPQTTSQTTTTTHTASSGILSSPSTGIGGGAIGGGGESMSWKRGPNRRDSARGRGGARGGGVDEEEEEMTIYQHQSSYY